MVVVAVVVIVIVAVVVVVSVVVAVAVVVAPLSVAMVGISFISFVIETPFFSVPRYLLRQESWKTTKSVTRTKEHRAKTKPFLLTSKVKRSPFGGPVFFLVHFNLFGF